jgi:hypothetical protein
LALWGVAIEYVTVYLSGKMMTMEQTGSENAQDREAQDTQEQPKDILKEDSSKLKVMEYRTLRAEELRRIDLRYRLVQLSFTSFGAILAFGVQLKLSIVLLLYPFLMLWLALLWRQNADMLMRIRAYIVTQIEVEDVQWERMLKTQFHPIWNYDTAIKFLFICADLITLGIGVSENPQNIVFIIISGVCTLLAALLLFVRLPIITEFVDTPPYSM